MLPPGVGPPPPPPADTTIGRATGAAAFPAASVAATVTVNVPAFAKVWVPDAPAPVVPPPKSHVGWPAASADHASAAPAVMVTVWPAEALAGTAGASVGGVTSSTDT